MRITTFLTSAFLSYAAYDLNLFRRRKSGYQASSAIEHSLAGNELKEREQKKVKYERTNVIPPWLLAKQPKLRMKCNHFSGKSKDPRDSNQRAIRRKFSNM